MWGIHNFETFILAGVLLNLTPGADTMYILGRSVANGKRAGIISALAISTGSLIHTILTAMGLSVLLAESQLAFNIVKYIGAGYLIYLGLKMMINQSHKIIQTATKECFQSNRKISQELSPMYSIQKLLYFIWPFFLSLLIRIIQII